MPMHDFISMPTAYANALCSTIARAMLCALVCSRQHGRFVHTMVSMGKFHHLGVEAFIAIALFLIFALPGIEAPDADDIADGD